MKPLNLIKQTIITELKQMFPDTLSEIILYGSYARGDFNKDSDIDFAAIVKIDRQDVGKYNSKLGDLVSKLSLKYDLFPSIHCIPEKEFIYWKQDLPYYRNIDKEGIRLNV